MSTFCFFFSLFTAHVQPGRAPLEMKVPNLDCLSILLSPIFLKNYDLIRLARPEVPPGKLKCQSLFGLK